MKNQWFLLVNPASGNGKGLERWPSIEKALHAAQLPFVHAMSEYPGHIAVLAQQALAKGYRKLVAVGGDGTAHEAINGIFTQQDAPVSQITFGIIPVGTGNDWIRTHNIPRQVDQAIALLRREKTLLQDIGHIGYMDMDGVEQGRFFINVAGLGYQAYVTRKAKNSARWMGDRLFYLSLAIRCLSQYKSTRLGIKYGGQYEEGNIYSVAIGICPYNGGGARFVPHTLPSDGLFALTFFKDIGAWDVIKNTHRFYDGTITQIPQAVSGQYLSVEVLAVDGSELLLEADGEFLGKGPAHFEILPKALRVVVNG